MFLVTPCLYNIVFFVFVFIWFGFIETESYHVKQAGYELKEILLSLSPFSRIKGIVLPCPG